VARRAAEPDSKMRPPGARALMTSCTMWRSLLPTSLGFISTW